MDTSASSWTPGSWRSKPTHQQPVYEDQQKVEQVLKKISSLPPLVHQQEIEMLKQNLAEAQRGERFVLQGGDCAELFSYCNTNDIENKLKVLIQMSLVLVWGGRIPLVRLWRGAGQYAKPRTKPTEMLDGQEILSYRGDNVNGYLPDERQPDPERLLGAYFHSAATWNYVRALLSGGFADLHKPHQWALDHVRSSAIKRQYEDFVNRMLDALDFMKTIHADNDSSTQNVPMYCSHEGLLLQYEENLTRLIENKWYNCSTHFLWIGDRTRQLDHGHIEYFRGIANPIGVKVGPSMESEELVKLIKTLNPNDEPGKITLIARYGSAKATDCLKKHIKAVQNANLLVLWMCDPMHGNTETTKSGMKTRSFDKIIDELRQHFLVHQQCGSKLGGVHLELTGDGVTECVGGSMEMHENDLSQNYQTYCDPRLNYDQSMDVAFLIARYYETERKVAAERG